NISRGRRWQGGTRRSGTAVVPADGTFQKEKPVGCCNRFDDKSAWTKRWTEERLVDEEEVYRGFRRMPPGWSDDSRKSSLKTKG
ncbi:hypothetical protein, partial [Geobacillus stearothermophilus]|uniref:hypothetical protein n=1 Tax=Geobacillus stearothermophilus TaxID=1422 RepID=UPI003D1F14F4